MLYAEVWQITLETNIHQHRFEKLCLHLTCYVLLSLCLCLFHSAMENIMKCLKTTLFSKLAKNYRGYLQTEGTGVGKERACLG